MTIRERGLRPLEAPTRFVVTGSGRCGTKYISKLLTAAGVPCGHEQVFNAERAGIWPAHLAADSSWMAAAQLQSVNVPVVLLVRHPLSVVASWVEIGFFSEVDAGNPTHAPLRLFAPEVYEPEPAADRALSMWLALNEAALARAELVLRLERLRVDTFGRLLRWAGVDPVGAPAAFRRVQRTNRHANMRHRTGVRHVPDWEVHRSDLAERGRRLARLLGYDPEEVPGG